MSSGTTVAATANDPDGDGGTPVMVDDIVLAAGEYDLTMAFQNRLENPPEEITDEVRDEQEEHQVFLIGTAVSGPASPRTDAPPAADLHGPGPQWFARGAGQQDCGRAGYGTLRIVLRHMPPINNAPVKTTTAAETVRSGGFAGLGGATDVQVDFQVAVM